MFACKSDNKRRDVIAKLLNIIYTKTKGLRVQYAKLYAKLNTSVGLSIFLLVSSKIVFDSTRFLFLNKDCK